MITTSRHLFTEVNRQDTAGRKPIAGVPVRQGEKVFAEPRRGSARSDHFASTIGLLILQFVSFPCWSHPGRRHFVARARHAPPVRAHYVKLDRSPWQALTEGGRDSKGRASPGRRRIFHGFRVGRRAYVSHEKPTGMYK
jgi:hypothetical protein